MQRIIALIGPTAIGKTDLSLELASQLGCEIISGDSMQVYQEVSIGTAKATKRDREQVKHWLVDTQSVFEPFSVKDFVDQAQVAVEQISQANKLPLVVGGTGFYLNALINDLQLGESTTQSSSIDREIQTEYEQVGAKQMWDQLNLLDPVAADKIPVENVRRTLRALTVIKRTGKSFSAQQVIQPRYNALIIGLNSDRERLYARINQRVDLMVKQGLIEEAKFVYDNREHEFQILQAIGYKEFFPYFAGEKSLSQCVDDLKQASRRYAKRQLTYFRNKLSVHWFDPFADQQVTSKILELVKEWQNE